MHKDQRKDKPLSEAQIIQRRDEAVRRALNTPPKPYKESKVGQDKPKYSPPSGRQR